MVNRQGRTIADMLGSTTEGVIAREVRFRPVISLVNNRKCRYGLQPLAVQRT